MAMGNVISQLDNVYVRLVGMDLTVQVRKPDVTKFLVWWKIPSDIHNYVAMKIFVFSRV